MPRYSKKLGEYVYSPSEWKKERARLFGMSIKLWMVAVAAIIIIYLLFFNGKQGVSDPGTLSQNATMTK